MFSNIRPFCLFRSTITTNFYSLNAAALSAPLTINLNVFIKMSLQPTKKGRLALPPDFTYS